LGNGEGLGVQNNRDQICEEGREGSLIKRRHQKTIRNRRMTDAGLKRDARLESLKEPIEKGGLGGK